MGVAWHRFSAFFNIYFKRNADGAVALGPLLAHDQRRQADRLRGSGRGRRLRPREDRGLHLEGDAGLHHLHRVRAVPEPVPGVEHGQAAQPEDGDHGPARPPLREGPLPARREDRVARPLRTTTSSSPATSRSGPAGYARIEGTNDAQAHRPLVGTLEEGGVIDPDVLWSCTNCGACVEQCPVDIEHVDHILDMRRYQVLIESNFPSEAGVMLRNLENRGNPWGMGGNVREDWIKELDFEVRMADGPLALRGRVPVLGRLRRRHRRPRQEGHQGRRRAAAHRRRRVRRPRRRARPARATRPAAWATSSSSSSWRMENVETLNGVFEGRVPGTPQDRRHLPALLQLAGPGVPAGRRRVRGHPPHAAARPAGRGGPAHPGHPGRPQGDLPRPVLPRPAQQGLHAPARDPRLRPGPHHPGDAPLQGPRLLLRRRRCAHVDGGEDRQADQRRAHRGGARARPRRHLHRLPVLHHDAVRRADTSKKQNGEARSTSRSSTSARSCCARWPPVAAGAQGAASGPDVGTKADDPAGPDSAATEHDPK